jgi:hypothetical protein
MRARSTAAFALLALMGSVGIAEATPSRWRTYRSPQGGYKIQYPRSWRASTLHPQPGLVWTTFAARHGGTWIRVYTYPGHGPGTDNPIPDVNCHAVTIGGIHGRRCRQLASGSPVTILSTSTRTYRISCRRGTRAATYDRLANSFRLLPTAGASRG